IAGRAGGAPGMRTVTLRLERLPRRGTRCTWLDPARGLRRRSCARPPSLVARVGASGTWTYRVARDIRLPPGRYRITAHGRDATGVLGNAAPRRKRAITFAISRN
ncbi:MAG: hypothetical protein ACRDLN_17345, partial [Solirubrobacteraceae bacterium]